MVFSSPIFLFIFLPVVFLLVVIAPKRVHNIILLLASLFFYSWGSISQTPIFIFSIVINYFFGLLISNDKSGKSKFYVTLGIIANLSLLAYFKYFNFLIQNINSVFSVAHIRALRFEKVALPIGISFYTFHAMSYIIDVYRKRVPAQKNFLDLALYISFFPQLIAGPIVRYIDVATQFQNRTMTLEKISFGIKRFIFGFAKKVIIANTMALIADQVFNAPIAQISPGLAWLGIIAYTFQIYFDFSGYSDMALGLAKIFGFNFPENFNYPYVAQSIKEFWRRWHISLSTWFRDFLYIPLGGNKKGEGRTLLNLLIVFFCTGFWHGASWNFIVWGMFHGTFLLIERMGFENILARTWRPIRTFYTLLVVIVGWVFFRAVDLTKGIEYLGKMCFISSGNEVTFFLKEYLNAKVIFILIFATAYSFRLLRKGLEIAEGFFVRRELGQSFQLVFQTGKFAVFLFLSFISILYLSAGTYNPFIYFRF